MKNEYYFDRSGFGESDLNDLIDNAKSAQLRSFLKDAVSDNEDLAVRLQTYLTPKNGKVNINANKQLVDRVVDKYTRHGNYISYRFTGDFIIEMEDVLCHSIDPLIKAEKYDDAFDLLGYVFIQTVLTDMDDDGELSMFGDFCAEYWGNIIAKADKTQKPKYFKWFEEHIDGSLVDYMEDYLLNAMENFFDDKEFLGKKLEFAEKKAASIADISDYHNKYEKERWVMLHIGFMEKSKCSDEEIFAYCKENRKLPQVRQYCAEKHISRNEIPAAIAVLKESLEIDKDAAGLISSHRHKLKDLYKQLNDTESYREQLRILLTKCNAGVDDYRELKSLYSPKEWNKERENIFISNYHKADFYREEKLWDRLLKYVTNNSIFDLKRYEPDLVKIYPQEILQLYVSELKRSAKQAHSRSTYSQWAQTLKHMKTIEGGPVIVNELLNEWRQVYRNRPAMMQELEVVD